MKTEVKKSSLAMLVMQRNFLLCLSLFLLVTTLCLSLVALRRESITLFKAPETKLDLSGAQSQGEFLTHLILNRSLASASSQNDTLYPWIDPSYLFTLKQSLEQQKQEMERTHTTFEWTLLDSTIESLDNAHVRIFLEGMLSAYLPIQEGKKQLIQQEKTAYILDLHLKNGKLLLTHFRKGEAHA